MGIKISDSGYANIATVFSFVLYVILTLLEKWDAISKWKDLFMLSNISIIVLMVGVIFAGIAYYRSTQNKAKGNRASKPRRLIQNQLGYVYLVEGNECWHIPDPPTLHYQSAFFGLNIAGLELMPQNEIAEKYTTGKQLPTIKQYFPNS